MVYRSILHILLKNVDIIYFHIVILFKFPLEFHKEIWKWKII